VSTTGRLLPLCACRQMTFTVVATTRLLRQLEESSDYAYDSSLPRQKTITFGNPALCFSYDTSNLLAHTILGRISISVLDAESKDQRKHII
jgi:hypothetical protein